MELPALQDAFQRFVLDGTRGVEMAIAPGHHDNREARLQIYYDAYRARLLEALSSDYNALRAMVGEAEFRSLCFAYVEATRSSWRNVRWYGGGLADFLMQTAPWKDEAALSECARFEWTLTLAFDAADEPHLAFETIAALPSHAWTTLRLRFHPSVQIIALHGNAHALRTAVDAGTALPHPTWSEDPIDWLIWRQDNGVRFRSLAGLESIALRAARGGASFPEICAGLLDYVAEEDVAAHAAGFLRAWVDDALIATVSYDATDTTRSIDGNEKPAMEAGS